MNGELDAISKEFFAGSHRQGMKLVEAAILFREERIILLEAEKERLQRVIDDLSEMVAVTKRELDEQDAKIDRLGEATAAPFGGSH